MERKRVRKKEIDYFPSGSTLLNCACSDNPFGAYKPGTIVTVPGSSASGKTALLLTAMAEASISKKYRDYDFFHDDCEEAMSFDIKKIFGRKLAEMIQPPGGFDKEGDPVNSNTIQDFKNFVLNKCKNENPFLYVLDSFDSLTSEEELKKEYAKAIKAAKTDEAIKAIAGSYKTEKAKVAGEILRMIKKNLKKTRSILFIIQQERDKINTGPFSRGSKKTTSGGRAPFFYSSHQVWLNKIKTLKATNDRKTGQLVMAKVTKNKITGKLREVVFPIYYDYGVDDIGSCVDFLINEGWWKKKERTIICDDLDIAGSRSTLIKNIEENNLENELKKITGKCWLQIEEETKLNRKRRFG